VERLDVRVPDAAAGHADLRQHAARPDLQGGGGRQIEYGRQRGVPWGISESGYNTVDVHLNYQYRAFGVPGLGLKRGLADDLVIAPYASALALMVAPEEACLNLQRWRPPDSWAASDSSRRSTTRRRGSDAGSRVRWFIPTWPTTRA
jgi:hypothetical protein